MLLVWWVRVHYRTALLKYFLCNVSIHKYIYKYIGCTCICMNYICQYTFQRFQAARGHHCPSLLLRHTDRQSVQKLNTQSVTIVIMHGPIVVEDSSPSRPQYILLVLVSIV